MSFDNNNDQNNTKNLFIAVGLFLVFMFGYDYFFGDSQNNVQNTQIQKDEKDIVDDNNDNNDEKHDDKKSLSKKNDDDNDDKAKENITLEESLAKKTCISFDNKKIKTSIDLKGGIIDSVILNNYKKSTDKDSQNVSLFIPKDVSNSYYYYAITYRDKSNNETIGIDDVWSQISGGLSFGKGGELESQYVVLYLKKGNGLIIERTITFDDGYMIDINDKLINTSNNIIKLSNSSDLIRSNPQINNYAVVHEGIVGNFEKKVDEIKYSDINEKKTYDESAWCGYTDIYWFASIINNDLKNNKVSYSKISDNVYKCSLSSKKYIKIDPNSVVELKYSLFVGPKDLSILKSYESTLNIDKFDMAIDFGWFFMLTKPLLYIMEILSDIFHNMGIVILILTLFFKIITYPLMKKSFSSAARMREVQPKISMIQKMYSHDKIRMNQELMSLYKKEKISPMSGCLPMLLQAPIFFCLYKVFFISIDMRHAPLFGWVHDLSAPDNLYIFNLFGILDFDLPKMLQIGVWPIIMGLSMFIQQKLSTSINKSNTQKTPETKMQENMMLILPLVFTYVCSSFPVGVVVYWTISNVFSIIQQVLINKKTQHQKKA